jgi:hypothetical protein
MTTDVSIPWHKNSGKFLEINYSPYLAGKSKKSAKIIDKYINKLMPHKKHLYTHIFIGDQEALSNSQDLFSKKVESGEKIALITDQFSMDYTNQENRNQASSLYSAWFSILVRQDIESIIVNITNDELIKRGLPSNKIDEITVINQNIASKYGVKEKVNAFESLMQLLLKFKS